MSDTSAFGFGKFIPGFDFLHNLSKSSSAGSTGLPPFSHWVAPTMRVEEIEKRIEELKAVQFWLDQNSKALAATVQALEVQRMTLSTLKGMNVNLADLAAGFPFAPGSGEQANRTADLSQWPMSGTAQAAVTPTPTEAPSSATPQDRAEAAPQATAKPAAAQTDTADSLGSAAQTASMAAATQWWSALTQQFQHIAQQALQDPVQQQAVAQATQMTTEFAKSAVKAATDMLQQAVVQTPTKKQESPSTRPDAAAAPSSSNASVKRAAAVKKTASADKEAASVQAKVPSRKTPQSASATRKKPTR